MIRGKYKILKKARRVLVMDQWLDEHLESFVKPYLGYVPNIYGRYGSAYGPSSFPPKRIATLIALWKQAKVCAKDRTILLPGRDVWMFELLARLEGYPSVFRPDISSLTPQGVKEDYRKYHVIDTGYRGSVAKALGIPHFSLISYTPSTGLPVKEQREEKERFQIFPKGSGSVTFMCGTLESIPKYWSRATLTNTHKIVQKLAPKDTFEDAAVLTRHVAEKVIKSGLLIRGRK